MAISGWYFNSYLHTHRPSFHILFYEVGITHYESHILCFIDTSDLKLKYETLCFDVKTILKLLRDSHLFRRLQRFHTPTFCSFIDSQTIHVPQHYLDIST